MKFETTGKCFCKNDIRKNGVNVFIGPRRESDVRQKIISVSHQGDKGANRNYCCHFSVTFETTGKFSIVIVRLILGKVGVDGFTRHRWEREIRYECDLEAALRGLGCK